MAESIGEDYAIQLDQFERSFPQILRFSLLVTLMNTVEDSIVTLCHGVRQILGLREKFKLRGSDVIKRAIKYLERNTGIDRKEYEDLYNFVDNLRNLRNCVVHSKGNIRWRKPAEQTALRGFIEGTSTLEINCYDKTVILEGFIEKSTKDAKKLIEKLIELIRKKLN